MREELKEFSSEYLGICAIDTCNRQAICFIRTLEVCQRCFDKLKIDNVRRFKRRLNIPTNWDVLKEEKKSRFVLLYDKKTGRFNREYL
jgi:hypothetical protein